MYSTAQPAFCVRADHTEMLQTELTKAHDDRDR
jgi:hypothetical protein